MGEEDKKLDLDDEIYVKEGKLKVYEEKEIKEENELDDDPEGTVEIVDRIIV